MLFEGFGHPSLMQGTVYEAISKSRGSLASQTLIPVWGCGRKCGGEKESGVSGPYSVAMWNAIIGKVT